MHVGVHLCRGNFVKSRHFSEGGYDRIAKKLFQDLDVDTYYLEYDTPRAGGFAPLKYLPSNKNVILGVITSKFPKMENPDELTSKVFEAADIIAHGSGNTQGMYISEPCLPLQHSYIYSQVMFASKEST